MLEGQFLFSASLRAVFHRELVDVLVIRLYVDVCLCVIDQDFSTDALESNSFKH
jgi:hypothetical protein